MHRFLLLVLLALPAFVSAQGTTDVLAGGVKDPDGKPLVGAMVPATSDELGTTRSVLTDENGRFMILFPEGSGWRLSVRKSGKPSIPERVRTPVQTGVGRRGGG